MAAAATDKFMKVGIPGTATTLGGAGHSIAGTSITVVSTSNWPSDTGVPFAIDRAELVNVGGEQVEQQIPGTYTEWTGTVASATSITNLTLSPYSPNADQNYPAGSLTRVYIPVTSTVQNKMVEGLTVQHKQDGTHANTITTDTINENTSANGVTIDGLNIKDGNLNTNNSVPAAALDTDAITLGYAQITADHGTTSTSAAIVTGLSAAVTIPAGGRRIKITVSSGNVYNIISGNVSVVTVWDGTVGSGTRLRQSDVYAPAANVGGNFTTVITTTPSAGAKTYNVGLHTAFGGGTAIMTAAATNPAFILVEAI